MQTILPERPGNIDFERASTEDLRKVDLYWRAARYLSVGQIYLLDTRYYPSHCGLKHIKPSLLGHSGTTSVVNFIYAHRNLLIRKYDLNMIYITGPGHGGPGPVANTWLEGSDTEF